MSTIESIEKGNFKVDGHEYGESERYVSDCGLQHTQWILWPQCSCNIPTS
jgi:hypothetical protein